jgi:hypothetical protein
MGEPVLRGVFCRSTPQRIVGGVPGGKYEDRIRRKRMAAEELILSHLKGIRVVAGDQLL